VATSAGRIREFLLSSSSAESDNGEEGGGQGGQKAPRIELRTSSFENREMSRGLGATARGMSWLQGLVGGVVDGTRISFEAMSPAQDEGRERKTVASPPRGSEQRESSSPSSPLPSELFNFWFWRANFPSGEAAVSSERSELARRLRSFFRFSTKDSRRRRHLERTRRAMALRWMTCHSERGACGLVLRRWGGETEEGNGLHLEEEFSSARETPVSQQ
jgi:hypothetical protein